MSGPNKSGEEEANIAEVVKLADAPFIAAVRGMVEQGSPAGWTMLAVACQNLEPIMMATTELAEENPGRGVPADVDGVIRFISNGIKSASDEIGRRRLMWLFQAALIRRATEIASRTPALQPDVAAIWILISRGCALIPEILAQNQLWSSQEKEYFTVIHTEKEGLKYGLHILAPAYLRKSDLLTKFAESNGILLLPW